MRTALIATALVLLFIAWNIARQGIAFGSAPMLWANHVSPGNLSTSHAQLEMNCEECHAPYLGSVRDRCVMCHSAPTDLLKKQNTAFHANVTDCTSCHVEHQGRGASITTMDHTHLALVAEQMLSESRLVKTRSTTATSIIDRAMKSSHGAEAPIERNLNCVFCHAYQDKHRTFFGNDCIECHGTTTWAIAVFRHPASSSQDCSQCHQAPPSHYMMHFEMVSEKVAGREHMQVSQCYACHQATAWNDIKGVGWYKHH